jgi:hypothetical protein
MKIETISETINRPTTTTREVGSLTVEEVNDIILDRLKSEGIDASSVHYEIKDVLNPNYDELQYYSDVPITVSKLVGVKVEVKKQNSLNESSSIKKVLIEIFDSSVRLTPTVSFNYYLQQAIKQVASGMNIDIDVKNRLEIFTEMSHNLVYELVKIFVQSASQYEICIVNREKYFNGSQCF